MANINENTEIRIKITLGTLRKMFHLMTEKEKVNLLASNFQLLTQKQKLKPVEEIDEQRQIEAEKRLKREKTRKEQEEKKYEKFKDRILKKCTKDQNIRKRVSRKKNNTEYYLSSELNAADKWNKEHKR